MFTRMLRIPLAALAGAAALALVGCAASTESPATSAADAIQVTDGWVKASDGEMTAGFATLTNTSDTDITVVSAETDAAPHVELHETVGDTAGAMRMQEAKGGFTVPANGSLVLEPGGHHLMLMQLPAAVKPGDMFTMTLTFADNTTATFPAVGKEIAGGAETYGDSAEGGAHEGSGQSESGHSEPGHSGEMSH